jgi:glyoxylase-like metal-dependent hydrolase (beta-lactamase superfamily II)
MNQKEPIKFIKLILSLFVLITNISCIANTNSDFVVTTITQNVYSIVSPSKGLPTPENKGWNSNIHFVVTGKGVLLFDTGSSESIGNKIKKAIKTVTNQAVRWVINSHSHADH